MTLDGLRHLERKTATVCTLLKASVYSIVLQQQIFNENEQQQQQQQQQQQRNEGRFMGEGDATTMMAGDEDYQDITFEG